MRDSDLAVMRAAIASKCRSIRRCPTDEAKAELRLLRRDYRAAQITHYVEALVDAAPPLTPEQCDKISLLLRGGIPS